MPFLLVYSASDFVGGLPREQNAAAQGRPPFTLTLRADAQPQVIEVTDNDADFSEIDGTQSVTSTVTIGSQTIPAGTPIHTAYDLLNSGSGHQVTSLHLGGNGYQQGAVDGLVSSTPLQPGQSYVFDTERTSYLQDNAYDDFVACFTAGSWIDTATGARRIETLQAGDQVWTADHGLQPLRWIGRRRVAAEGALAPVRFAPGTLGASDGLEVSPNHRMLVSGPACDLHLGQPDALVPAKAFVNGREVTRRTGGSVTYIHLLFDNHEIVRVNGVLSETLLVTEQSRVGLSDDPHIDEVLRLFPQLAGRQAARSCLTPREAALMLS